MYTIILKWTSTPPIRVASNLWDCLKSKRVMVLRSKYRALIEMALLTLVYGFCIALASALWNHPMILTGAYVLVSFVVFYKWHSTADVVAFITAAVLGPLGESIAIHYGAWTYSKSMLIIPIWLPFLWGIAGTFLRRLTTTIANFGWNKWRELISSLCDYHTIPVA